MSATVSMKKCSHCGQDKLLDEFGTDNSRLDGLKYHCKDCVRIFARKSHGSVAYNENKSCSLYLGVYIAEPMLLNHYGLATKMPVGNPGYDYLCGKGYKIYEIGGKS